MNKPKLNGMQLLTAGTLLGKIIEETQKIKIEDNTDDDVKKALDYLLEEFEGIDKKIIKQAYLEVFKGMKKIVEGDEEDE